METSSSPPVLLRFIGPYAFAADQGCNRCNCLFEASEISGPGIYMFIVQAETALRVLYVGETGDARTRFRMHLECYLSGKYRVYDVNSLSGDRPSMVYEFNGRPDRVLEHYATYYRNLAEMLGVTRVYFAPLMDFSMLKRVETALITMLRSKPRPNAILRTVHVLHPCPRGRLRSLSLFQSRLNSTESIDALRRSECALSGLMKQRVALPRFCKRGESRYPKRESTAILFAGSIVSNPISSSLEALMMLIREYSALTGEGIEVSALERLEVALRTLPHLAPRL